MNQRKAKHKINDLFIKRWSPRAMSGKPIKQEELMQIFEAARWAPSSYNGQPWHFLYAKRDTKEWNIFFKLLVEFNQQWVKNAAILCVVLSKKIFDHNGKPNSTHSFDTGAAWENLALQGSIINIVVHGMAGFDYDKAKTVLKIPDDYDVEAMIAIGKPGKKEDLPEAMREKEFPSERKKVEQFVTEGAWKAP